MTILDVSMLHIGTYLLDRCSAFGRLSSAAIASTRYVFPQPGSENIKPSRWSNPALVHAVSCFGAALVVFLLWPLAQQNSHALAFCVLFGILGGSLFSLPASGVAYILPKDLGDSLGAWTGIMWALGSVFALAGPPIVGQLVKRSSIDAVGYWTGANLLVAWGLISMVTWSKHHKDQRDAGKDSEQSMSTITSAA